MPQNGDTILISKALAPHPVIVRVRNKYSVPVLLSAALALAGCVSQLAEPRVRSALVEAGLSQANAACMAERMTDRLTIGQLRRLEHMRGAQRSLSDFVAAVRRVGDAETIAVTASAAALCATGLAPERR